MQLIRKSCVTLIEMMIVMFLIAMILGIVAYNYRGSLDEGKAFKTQTGIEKLQTILNLAIADNPNHDLSNPETWKQIIQNSPLVQNPSSLMRDGWGEEYEVQMVDGEIIVTSRRFEEYKEAHPTTMFK